MEVPRYTIPPLSIYEYIPIITISFSMVATATTTKREEGSKSASPPSNGRAPKRRWLFHRGAPATPLPPSRRPAAGGMDATPKISNTAPRSSIQLAGTGVPPPPPIVSPQAKDLPRPHWVCRTKYFQSICDQAFATIDIDGSGCVDEKELYTGLLLIHLQLGMYAGPAACKPLSRERLQYIFHKMDVDQSHTLEKKEFQNCMAVLFTNVILRVMVQWAMTLMIVPWLAQFIVQSVLLRGLQGIYYIVSNLDEHSRFFQWIELTLEGIADYVYENWLPSVVIALGSGLGRLLAAIPASVWSILPLTVVSTLLGMLVVPYCIYQVDDFFQRLADRHGKKVK